jgi:dCTP deaminase
MILTLINIFLTLTMLCISVVFYLVLRKKTLTDKEILQEIENGNIVIDGFKMEHLNPNSVDLTLNPEMIIYNEDILDCRKPNKTSIEKILDGGYVLYPNRVYLYHCNERIGVKKNIHAEVMGKSSLGRLGLGVHITAGFIDTGFEGSLVLELFCQQPIRIYPNMKICQVKFMYNSGDFLETYDQKKGSKYMNQSGTQASLMHKNFEDNGK